MSRLATIIVAAIGTSIMIVFIVGLSHSISTGFAGFWGGFPFMVIVIFVICLALYDFWEEAIKGKR
ncbi:MAG: hypothetical protein AAGC96_09325 [Pseudomonadota bacterium]